MPIQLVSDEVEIWNRALARVGDNRLKLDQIIHVALGTANTDPIQISTIPTDTFVDGEVNTGTARITLTSHDYDTGSSASMTIRSSCPRPSSAQRSISPPPQEGAHTRSRHP